MRKILPFFLPLLTLLLTTQCQGPRGVASAYYTNDGLRKPVVGLLPVQDLAKGKVYSAQDDWNISEELTGRLAARIDQRDNMIILPKEQFSLILEREKEGYRAVPNPLDFRVSVEILQNVKKPYDRKKIKGLPPLGRPDHMLEIRYRLTVEDVRDQAHPKIVLQELRETYHPVTKKEEIINYELENWKQDAYLKSPLGQGHLKVAEEVASRLYEYLPYYENS